MKKFFENKIVKKYLWSVLIIFCGILFLFLLFSGKVNKNLSDFLETIENKTFDLRQKITSEKREHNSDIVILAIDDYTYEKLVDKYGEWPMPRFVYADIVNFIEKQNPKLIAFDLVFAESAKEDKYSNAKLSEVFKKYDNLFTSMNFDDLTQEQRAVTPINNKLAVNIDNRAKVNFMEFPNHRPLSSDVIKNTTNIGHINIRRPDDGVIRDIWPFVKYLYDGKMYPHIALLVSQYINDSKTKDFLIDKNNLKFKNKSYPITKEGMMYLNWYKYDPEKYEVFEHIPLGKVVNAIEDEKQGKESEYSKDYFKDKIIYVATTAPNLGDLKTVPIAERLPGVELHTTFVNNMLDGSFIHRLTFGWDYAITLLLCLIVGLSMMKVEYSKINYKYFTPIHFSILIGTLLIYYFLSYLLMLKLNLWIAVIMPTIGVILTFIGVYAVRYFFKSRDYELTYRLATTDGLTDLYNHRYFQEQMIANIEKSKKSGKKFSLILTDIDFFKKFNDKYGHQSGDAVLRLVARTLKKNVKKTDLVCRYGGEEMSVILINADKQKATEVAQRLCNAVSETKCQLGFDLEVNVTISLGVATYPDDGNTPSELIEYSDKGLYFAKENGRNQVGVIKE